MRGFACSLLPSDGSVHPSWLRPSCPGLFSFLRSENSAVKRNPAVVAYDASAPVGIRQTGEQACRTGQARALGVASKYAVVMRLAVETEMFFNYGIQAGSHTVPAPALRYGMPSVQIDDAFQRGVGLQADDYFIFFIDITGGKIIDTGDGSVSPRR